MTTDQVDACMNGCLLCELFEVCIMIDTTTNCPNVLRINDNCLVVTDYGTIKVPKCI